MCGGTILLPDWLAMVQEDAIEPELEIVDSHHHIYDPFRHPMTVSPVAKLTSCCSVGFRISVVSAAFGKPAIEVFGRRNLLFEPYNATDLINDFGGHNVKKSVFVEVGITDTKKPKELQGVIGSKVALEYSKTNDGGFPHAYICHIDLVVGREKVLKAIDAHLAVNPNVRGVRDILANHDSKKMFSFPGTKPHMMKNPKWREGFAALAEKDFSFDMYLYHTQLPEAIELAKAYPNVRICLDHIGQPLGVGLYASPQAHEQALKDWESSIRTLAECPNVHVKLSGGLMCNTGFGFEKRDKPPTSDEVVEALQPLFEKVLEAFGVDRCMFASNFPVDKVSCSYVVLFNAFKKMCQKLGLSDADKEKLFSGNATKFYKL